jgi:hypothetical protein
VTLAREGAGLVQAYRFIVEQDLARGALVEVLASYAGATRPFTLLSPPGRVPTLAVRLFADALVDAARTLGAPPARVRQGRAPIVGTRMEGTRVERFTSKLEPVPHGGLFVIVPAAVAARAGLKHADRVCGTVDGAPYRSALMKYSGVFHLGVHKATATAAKVGGGDRVTVTIALDEAPLPGDELPEDLEASLGARKKTQAAWAELAPSRRRELVKQVLAAKADETRARRIAKIVEALRRA